MFRSLRIKLIHLLADCLHVPIRVADDFWLRSSAISANQSPLDGRS
jgi:hypothetical protein